MQRSITKLYEERVTLAELSRDAAQVRVAGALDELAAAVRAAKVARARLLPLRRAAAARPRGIYLHGAVGRGKTMLMDLFVEATDGVPRRRIHFHEFMADVHERIKRGRETASGDPIPSVAAGIAKESPLLCLDELQVTDIADAMILGRLFTGLFENGVVPVITSNAAPRELYPNGLNRSLFLPFVDMLEASLTVLRLDADQDYRLQKLAGRPLYFSPLGPEATAALDEHWERLTGHHPAAEALLSVKGRELKVPMSSMGVARLGFADLCAKPLGALDYLHLAHAFHTIILDGIPRLGPEKRNEARRFIALIDTLYDNRVCLIASAACSPQEIYPEGDGGFLFERTVSRLMEMQSEAYLVKSPPRSAATAASAAS